MTQVAAGQTATDTSDNDSDKYLHAAISSVASATAYSVYRSTGHSRWSSIMGGIGWGAFAGVAKEISDPHIDPEDLKMDGLGILLGITVGISFDWD